MDAMGGMDRPDSPMSDSERSDLNGLLAEIINAANPAIRRIASNSTFDDSRSFSRSRSARSRSRSTTARSVLAQSPQFSVSTQGSRPKTPLSAQRHPGKPGVRITRTTRLLDEILDVDESTADADHDSNRQSLARMASPKYDAGSVGERPSEEHFLAHETQGQKLQEKERDDALESIPAEATAEETEGNAVQYPSPTALAFLITGICLSVFLISLDRTIITTVGPLIAILANV